MGRNALSIRAHGLGRSLLRPMALSLLMLASGPGAAPQSANPPEIQAQETTPKFRIRAERNLVIVRVVVRDPKGRTVGDLHKEDFRLLDDGKPQEITGFGFETANPKTTATEARSTPAATTGAATPPLPLLRAQHRSVSSLSFSTIYTLKSKELGGHATPLGATCRPASGPRTALPS